jgi:hypothetical protein
VLGIVIGGKYVVVAAVMVDGGVVVVVVVAAAAAIPLSLVPPFPPWLLRLPPALLRPLSRTEPFFFPIVSGGMIAVVIYVHAWPKNVLLHRKDLLVVGECEVEVRK